MSALYDADMNQDAPALVIERVITLKHRITGETLRVRLKRELDDRYVIGSVRRGSHWVSRCMKDEWRITTLGPAARAAITILLCGAVVAIAGLAILYANAK